MIFHLTDFSIQWGIVYLILFCASTVQGSVGFGFGLIAAPLLLLIQPQLLPGPLIVAALSLTLIMSVRGRRLVAYPLIPWLLLGFFPGLWLGAWLLQILSPRQTSLLFGSLILAAVAISCLGWRPQPKPLTLIPAGLFSALLSITTTMGGPPVALALQTLPGARFRHTLALYFTLAALLTLFALATIQWVGEREIFLGLALIPPVFLGIKVSGYFSRWLDQGRTRATILIVAALAGLMVTLRAWLMPT